MLRTALVCALVGAAHAADVVLLEVRADGSATEVELEAPLIAGLADADVVVTGDHIASATATYGFTFEITPPNGTTATALRDKTTACDFRITYSVRTMNETSLTNVSLYDCCVVPSGPTPCPQTNMGWIWCTGHPVLPAPAPDNNSTSIEPEPSSDSSGLSGGAIAGIVIGSIVGVAVLAFVIIFFFTNVFSGIGGGAASWVFASGTAAPAPAARHATLPLMKLTPLA
jgi:hypothetical protein